MKKILLATLGLLTASPAAAQMSLPGSFEVSETGAAIYTIPIAAPPGTAGLEPKLTLQYNSRSGNGLLGMGWSLGGLPAIVRCPKTIAQDGARGGINHDANDRFCLEGERLVAISGTYGADGTEYRTEREGFSKIVSYGSAGTGPAWFKVWTKAGQILEFGHTADSRIEAQGKSTARLWTVNKVSDTAGNYLSVTYAEDNANGEYRPTRIDYTGNAGASVSPYASVRFVYETRPTTDQTPLYEAGSLIKTTQRLTKVRAYIGESLVREYELAYDNNGVLGRSRFTALAVCEASAVCLPATSFGYSTGASAFTVVQGSAQINTAGHLNWPADFTGDGKTELAAWTSASLLKMHSRTASGIGLSDWNGSVSGDWFRYFGDFNGDGLTDIASWIPYSDGLVVRLHTATGSGFVSQDRSSGLYGDETLNWPGDFNGDGRTDIASWVGSTAGSTVRINFATGDVFTVQTWNSSLYNGNHIHTGDFNGDGRTDLLSFPPGSAGAYVRVHLSGENGFTIQDWATDLGGAWKITGDFNGDGKTDIAGWISETVLRVNLSTGAGFVAQDWTAHMPTIGGGSYWMRWVGDFNGDGKSDIASWKPNSDGLAVRMNLSSGSGFVIQEWTSHLYGDATLNWVGDFNGDGVTDIASWAGGSGGTSLRLNIPNGMPDLLTSIALGFGATTAISHAPLTEGGTLYTKDTGAMVCTYPCVDVQAAIHVVSEVQTSNGIGGSYTSTYRYAGAKADQSGRGFLGFRQVTVKDEQTLVEQATEYLQNWPFVGLTSLRTKTRSAVELNRTENSYAADDLGSGRRFVKLTQSLESSKELNGTSLPTVTTSYQYDSYGNATQVQVSTGDGHSKTTTNTYANDLTNWFLGRLTRAEVTSVTP